MGELDPREPDAGLIVLHGGPGDEHRRITERRELRIRAIGRARHRLR